MTVKREKSLTNRVMEKALQYNLVKDQIFKKAKSQVIKQTNGLYPAPLKVKSDQMNNCTRMDRFVHACTLYIDFRSSKDILR